MLTSVEVGDMYNVLALSYSKEAKIRGTKLRIHQRCGTCPIDMRERLLVRSVLLLCSSLVCGRALNFDLSFQK